MDIDYLNDPTVSVFIDPEMTAYPQKAPFHPSETFPDIRLGRMTFLMKLIKSMRL